MQQKREQEAHTKAEAAREYERSHRKRVRAPPATPSAAPAEVQDATDGGQSVEGLGNDVVAQEEEHHKEVAAVPEVSLAPS